MSSLPLWGGKKSIKKKRKKKHKIQTTWSQKLSCIFLQCNSIKPKLLVLTQLIRSLAQLTHHKEEIQPWTRGWGAGGCHVICSQALFLHREQKSSRLHPGHRTNWHCFYFWWKFPRARRMDGHTQGTRREGAQSISHGDWTFLLIFHGLFSVPVGEQG